ncbi:MAG TPA: Fe-S cluster assembly protein SufD [Anaerolineae bacterium]|nr:Fe-S cluster assembly protein SufD [Anaerolineae bacterium]
MSMGESVDQRGKGAGGNGNGGAARGEMLTLDINAAAVEAVSDYYNEPEWMRAARREAWTLYERLDWPHAREEAWRRLPLTRYPLTERRLAIAPNPVQALRALPACWLSPLAPQTQASGIVVHQNGAMAYQDLEAHAAKQGVVLTDLHAALHTHEDLIRRYWMQGMTARPDFNKFTALNAALWHGGTFVYLPAGARPLRPLQAMVGYDDQGSTGIHHTLIVVEKGARLTLIQDRRSREFLPELNAEVVEIYAEEGAWVRYVSLQHWGEQRYSVSVQNARVARDANLLWVNIALGGSMTKDFLRTDLLAPGARGLMQGFTFAMGEQLVDQSTYQLHGAPHTFSDLLFRNVLRDQAKTVFYGMIRVEPGAQGTQGYQANHNLLLGEGRAHAIPGLEIAANDVQCSHGATVSRLDEEQLFYLQARGIARPDAEQLLVQGFLRPIIERVPLACMREGLDEEIAQRFRTLPQ